jgi:uncharacterized protein
MLYKGVSDGAIKDVDTKTGTVTGYFSIFGNVDSDGDMIMPGAFKATLNTNYKRIKHLNQHRSYEPLSSVKNDNLMVKEDPKGLYFESKISQTSYGKDVIQLYQDGVLDEHSIGYEVIRQRDSDTLTRPSWNGQKVPVKELIELKLWEGSTVTWGANERATTESVKSLTKEQAFEKMNGILKAIKNGKYEQEDIYEMLELHFKQLEQHILDLSSCPEDVASSATPQKSVDVDPFDTDMILSYLHLKTFNTN